MTTTDLRLSYKKETGVYPDDIEIDMDVSESLQKIDSVRGFLAEINPKEGGRKASIVDSIGESIEELAELIADMDEGISIDLSETPYVRWLEEELIKSKEELNKLQ